MRVQDCADEFDIDGDHPEIDWSDGDPQSRMILQQIRFQGLVGSWDKRIQDYGSAKFCKPRSAVHHLDMAIQECAEAWDMVEGGWKHHKTNPDECDRGELLMELVDVAHFLVNAYIFMGGQPEKQMVAAAVGRSREELRLPEFGLDHAWMLGHRSYEGNGGTITALYGHGRGAHGQEWEAAVATRINYLRMKITEVSESIRYQMRKMNLIINGKTFPPASGYVYVETFPWLCGAVEAIPGSSLDTFYAAFMHKNDINFQRQRRNY